MKKFIKVIAAVTVMCLALSTAAFAAVDVTNYETKNVSIKVENVNKGEQVAIIITKSDATDFTYETILFVDQKVAGADTAEFEAEITDSTVKAIDIYAGYASNVTSEAVKVGNDIPLVQGAKLTLVAAQVVDDITDVTDKNGYVSSANNGTKGAAVSLKLNATNIAAGDLTKMFWAFHVTDLNGNNADTKYAKGDIAALGLGTVLSGEVEIAAAFDSTGYKIKGANAIFLIAGEDVHTATGDKLAEILGDKNN